MAQANAAVAYDRSDASVYYPGLFSEHRAGSSVYGGLIDDAVPPASERRHERRRRSAAEKGVRISRYAHQAQLHITAAEKSIIISVVILFAAILVAVIALQAYGVSVQHGINKKNAEMAATQKEIDELSIAIEEGSNIATIAKSAKKDLKMVYPSSGQIKYAKDITPKSAGTDVAEDVEGDGYGT
jgi:cell division protein FtsL